MPVNNPCILWGIRFSQTSYVLRVTNDGVTENLAFPATGTLSTTTDYYMSGDGGAYDLVEILRLTLESHSAMTATTVVLTSEFKLQIDDTNLNEFYLLWSSGSTTLAANIFGFIDGLDGYTGGAAITSPNVVIGVWRPKRPASDDGRNQRVIVGGVSSTLSGLTRVSSLVAPASLPRSRTMSWRNLVQSEVLDEYTEADDPYGAFEYAWYQSIGRGYVMRYYEDEASVAAPVYDTLSISSLTRPYARSGAFAVRWDVELSANVIVSGTYANTYSWFGDGANDYVDCTDVTTTDSATRCTWHMWFRIPTAWPSGTEDVLLSKWATNNQQWSIRAGTGTGTIVVSTPSSLTTDANYWTQTGSLFAVDTWYMLDVVYDGSLTGNSNRLKIYKNGVSITGSGTFSGTIPATLAGNGTSPIRIGANGTGLYFAGYLDEVAIWGGTALSADQVAMLYVTGHPTSLVSANASVSAPKHWWRLENNYLDSGTATTKAHGTASGGPVFSSTVLP